ncbi:MAG: YcxB family protein [Asgard group archaeon]|nr:YcxB family protein [Asgard group archaeon]
MEENQEKLTVSFTMEFDDFKKSFFEYYFQNKKNIILIILASIGVLLGIVLIITNIIMSLITDQLEMFVIVLTALLLFILLRPLIYSIRLTQIWSSTYRLPKDFSWVVTPEQIIITRQFGQNAYPWNLFLSIIEHKKSFCFFLSLQDYQFIPKRVLTEEQIELLRNLILASANPQHVKVKIKRKKK